MTTDSALIDRIVHGVLTQLAGPVVVRADASPEPDAANDAQGGGAGKPVEISERIVTAELLAERVSGATEIAIGARSIVTPAGWDYVHELGLTVRRGGTSPQATDHNRSESAAAGGSAGLELLLIVVRNTPAVDRLYEDLSAHWRRELLGCPDDAAKLAISAVSRGETSMAVILAEQAHRAACLANRNAAVKAVVVPDAPDVRLVRKQLRANVWCVDPENKSWFELRNLIRAIEK